MTGQTQEQRKLAEILVAALDLEEVSAEDIGVDAPEISLAVAQSYKVQLKADDESNRAIFASLRTLCDYIASQA